MEVPEMFETLESRRLFSVLVDASNTTVGNTGALTIKGGNVDNNFQIIEENGLVTVTDNTDASVTQFAGVTSIKIWGNSGRDQITYIGNSIGAVIMGNNGADTLMVGDKGTGASSIDGGEGDDVLITFISHNTTLNGGSGNDYLAVNEGADVNLAEFDYLNAQSVIQCSSGNDQVFTWSGFNTINGGSGGDTLVTILYHVGDIDGPLVSLSNNTYINVEQVLTGISPNPIPA
jgi:Ca2+-binding RTX toxin-like protein